MKLFGAVAILAAGTGAWAGDRPEMSKRVVMACMNPGASPSIAYRGEATATQILKQAGIQLNWRADENLCSDEAGIVIRVLRETPLDQHPGALAYALPFDRTPIVLFYDRVLETVVPAVVPSLLGHVLAHEIVHMLQGCARHSASGVMKAHWDLHDLDQMRRTPLSFMDEDLDLIERGLDWRAARGARP